MPILRSSRRAGSADRSSYGHDSGPTNVNAQTDLASVELIDGTRLEGRIVRRLSHSVWFHAQGKSEPTPLALERIAAVSEVAENKAEGAR